MHKTERKLDRRIHRTRTLLRDALMELIVEKGYKDLTVQDISDRADVARTTFYLHYKDVDDLLFNALAEIYDDLFRQAEPVALPSGGSMTLDFDHVAQYAAFYKVMLSEQGSMKFLIRMQHFLTVKFKEYLQKKLPPGHQPRVPLDVIAAMCAGSEIGMMTWWVSQYMPIPGGKMAEMGEGLTLHGLMWALGLENDGES
jgi:AcrR family transcriptional regulator